MYVGGSQDIQDRRRHHFRMLRQNKHQNKYFQEAFDKYGEDKFEFNILEFCDTEDLGDREQYWIDKFKSNQRKYGYNIRVYAQTNRGLRLSEETKSKISTSMKEANISISEEQRAKISIKNRGSKNGNAKLTENDVIKIKRLLKYTNMTQEDIARKFNISSRRVRGIKSGETWRHVAI